MIHTRVEHRRAARARARPGLIAAALAVMLLLSFGHRAAVGDVRVVDDRGRTISLEAPARRIVSLTPHLTENLFAIGAGDRIVGTTTFSDFPEAAKGIEVIGSHRDFDIERIVELEPDVVLGWISGNPAEPVSRIERLGLPLYLTEPRDPRGIASEIERLGALTGLESAATRTADEFLNDISEIRDRYGARDPVSVFYEVWNDPLITLNGEHLVSRLLADCGGVNVFADLTLLAPKVSVEAVLEKNPEAIISGGPGATQPDWLEDWNRYTFLLAAKRGNLFHVRPELIQRHTTRLVEGMHDLCELIDTARRRRP